MGAGRSGTIQSVLCLVSGFILHVNGRLDLKCDGTYAEPRFRLSAKWVSPFKWGGEPVQLTTGS
jgi:hypothetical protein